ncbi:spore germination protein [Bacillus carboniphilus]|uniref:Spore germination protein n=1 Tax=Bacillus carboniphilus TaxID=86663 RepID=A0ABN0VQQ2_9BACI
MPAIVGPVQIFSVSGGEVQFGDTFYVSPKSSSKTVAGSGGLNTGPFVITNNGLSATNYIDCNAVDQPITGNA